MIQRPLALRHPSSASSESFSLWRADFETKPTSVDERVEFSMANVEMFIKIHEIFSRKRNHERILMKSRCFVEKSRNILQTVEWMNNCLWLIAPNISRHNKHLTTQRKHLTWIWFCQKIFLMYTWRPINLQLTDCDEKHFLFTKIDLCSAINVYQNCWFTCCAEHERSS